jgi:WD40 repeat protein
MRFNLRPFSVIESNFDELGQESIHFVRSSNCARTLLLVGNNNGFIDVLNLDRVDDVSQRGDVERNQLLVGQLAACATPNDKTRMNTVNRIESSTNSPCFVLSGTDDATLRLFDVTRLTGAAIAAVQQVRRHSSFIVDCQFSPFDATSCASSANDTLTFVHDLRTPSAAPACVCISMRNSVVVGVRFLEEHLLLTMCQRGTVSVWDLRRPDTQLNTADVDDAFSTPTSATHAVRSFSVAYGGRDGGKLLFVYCCCWYCCGFVCICCTMPIWCECFIKCISRHSKYRRAVKT